MAVTVSDVKQNIKIEEIQKPVPNQICNWAAPTFGDIGQTVLHKVLATVAFAVGVWSAIEQMRVFNMRYKLAEDYARISQEQWDRFNKKYKPLELMAVSECLAAKEVKPDYPAALSLGLQMSGDGAAQARLAMAEFSRVYALCPSRSMATDFESGSVGLADDLVNFNYRNEETFALAKDTTRFNRRSDILNLGRNLSTQAASYGQTAASLLGAAANNLAQTTYGAFSLIGYLRNREVTAYPDWMIHNNGAGASLATAGPFTGSGLDGPAPMSVDATG
jgi:hypothetical protein